MATTRQQWCVGSRLVSNGSVVAFSAEEWRALGELMERALALPEMRLVLEDATLAYGET
jgi:hypothetical protein